jgi:hypothetical protein
VKRALLALVASLVLAAPAQAFTPPELFVRTQRWDTHEETGPWLPLATTPLVNYLGGYEIGYRLQASAEANNFQRVALTITGVPDGTPTQPSATPPFCVAKTGTVGTIVPAGPELQFEGNGTYTVKVALGDGNSAPTGCLSGPSTTRSFRVGVQVAPTLVGSPVRWRAEKLPGNPFVGVRAAAPPGGEADVRCVLGNTVIPDQSFSHPEVLEWVFPRPGVWACDARGTAEGQDENRELVRFATPRSAPITVEVLSDFRYQLGRILRARTKRPRFTFRAEWPAEARGGRGALRLYRVTGCGRTKYKLRRAGTFRAAFGARRVEIALRRPRAGFYIGRIAFGGTRFLRPMPFTDRLLMGVRRGRLKFLSTSEFAGACTR